MPHITRSNNKEREVETISTFLLWQLTYALGELSLRIPTLSRTPARLVSVSILSILFCCRVHLFVLVWLEPFFAQLLLYPFVASLKANIAHIVVATKICHWIDTQIHFILSARTRCTHSFWHFSFDVELFKIHTINAFLSGKWFWWFTDGEARSKLDI